LDAFCLFVAGMLRATIASTEMTVAWDHSVEKTRWEEHYRVDGMNLRLTQARIRSFGAGMEPTPDATLRDGWWTWQPRDKLLPSLRLTRSPFTRDYELCWRARCESLRNLTAASHGSTPPGRAGDDASIDVVDVRACRSGRAN
jgi:hypothetical protein